MDDLFGNAVDPLVLELWRVPGWPKDQEKDERFVKDLRRQFPTLDLVEEVQKWASWMLDYAPGRKVNHRARVRTWLGNAVRWKSEGRRLGRSRPVTESANRIARTDEAGLGW